MCKLSWPKKCDHWSVFAFNFNWINLKIDVYFTFTWCTVHMHQSFSDRLFTFSIASIGDFIKNSWNKKRREIHSPSICDCFVQYPCAWFFVHVNIWNENYSSKLQKYLRCLSNCTSQNSTQILFNWCWIFDKKQRTNQVVKFPWATTILGHDVWCLFRFLFFY